MWTPTTRDQYSRTALRYETDLTDAEWAIIEPHMPPPAKLGRPPDWTFREIIDGIFYILRGGIPWRLMPTDLPPWPPASGKSCRRLAAGDSAKAGPPEKHDLSSWRVVDDWPERVPVAPEEVDVFEAWF